MNQPLHQTSRILAGFCGATPQQLENLRAELGLQMPPQMLRHCQIYYCTREKKRAPKLDEIRLLDLLAALPTDGTSVALTELYTNDSFTAVTYADMMNKRREMHPEAASPITLGEAFGMASAYLTRSGKKSCLPATSPALLSGEGAFTGHAVGVQGSRIALHLNGASRNTGIEQGDLFMLVHRGNMPMWKYRTNIGMLPRSPGISGAVRRVLTVPRQGLLPMLLPLCRGVCFDMRRLSADGSAAPLTVLADHFAEYRVFVLPRDRADSISEIVRSAGFRPMIFATAAGGERTQFLFSAYDRCSLETVFLQRMIPRTATAAKLPAEQPVPADAVKHKLITDTSCPYLSSRGKVFPERIASGNYTVAGAFCKTGGAFHSAVETVLTALLSLAASGGRYTEARLAGGISLPEDLTEPDRAGEAMAAILGLYRVQTELGVPASALFWEGLADGKHPELTVYAFAASPALPSRFAAAGNRVYCVTPTRTADGLPDFEALRRLLSELAEWNRRGALCSARVLSREGLTDGLTAMSCDGLACRLTDPGTLTEDLPLAVLLESAQALPFSCIGEVQNSTSVPATAERVPSNLPIPAPSLIWSDTYEITLLAESTDTGAQILTALLRENGADCSVFSPDTPEGLLSRSVLTSRLLILCGAVSLPCGERMRFALRTQRDAGGAVICLGSGVKLPPDVSATHLPDGIPEEFLAQIRRQNRDFSDFSQKNPEKFEKGLANTERI